MTKDTPMTTAPDLEALREVISEHAKEAREELEAHREWLIENDSQPDPGCEWIHVHPDTLTSVEALFNAYEEQADRIDSYALAEAETDLAFKDLDAQIADHAATIATQAAEIERTRGALEGMRGILRSLQPAMNMMAREVMDDIIREQIDPALTTQSEA